MVAPRVETQLTRSLVRVPNSGRDRHAGAVLHDLSRVSSAAALVPITSYFALGILPSTSSRFPPPPLPMDKNPLKSTSKGVPCAATSGTGVMSGDDGRASRVMSRSTNSSATVNPMGSRKRPLQQCTTRIATEGGRSPKVLRKSTLRPTQPSHRPAPSSVAGNISTMQELLREREQLRAENMALKLELSRRVQQRVPSGTVGH